MPRQPDPGESGVLLDDYPRIQRRPEPVVDPENQRRRSPLRARMPKFAWGRVAVVAGALLAGGVLGWCLHPDARDTGGAAREALATSETRIQALEGELAETSRALAAEKATAATIIADRAREVADAAAATRAIADKLAAAAGSHGDVSIAGAEVRIVIGEKALFKPGDPALTATGHELLSSIGTALGEPELADRVIRVEGHTDDAPLPKPRGGRPRPGKPAPPVFASRWELAAARAIAVTRYLVEQVKLEPGRVGAASYAEHRPIGKARAKNRRIELVLSPPPATP